MDMSIKTFLASITLLAASLVVTSSVFAQSDFAVPPAPSKADFFKPGLAPVRRSPRYNLTIVYFFDYQCPACRKYTPQVSSVFDQDPRLRIIYRDTPIFGPNSTVAARLAIASQFQGRHEAFHRALMIERPPLIEPALRHAAAVARVAWPRLLRDLAANRAQIDRQIAQNENLSEAAGISGTPAFIVGQRLSNGALSRAALLAEIADARRGAHERPRR
jgi:protein-disulfide isomerase